MTIQADPAADQSIFGTSSADFARCLQAAGDAACFSGTRITVREGNRADATAPSGPSNLVATSSGSTVTLTWSAPASGDPVTAYIIEAGSSPGLSNLANFSTGDAATTFTASGVGNGTFYVRVRAQNAAGTGAASNEATLVVGGAAGCTGAPGAPSGLTGSATGGTVSLSWSAPGGGCVVTSYVLQAGSAPGLSDLANSAVGTSTSFSTGGVPGGTYYIRVRAQNASGQSAASNEVAVTVSGGPTSGAIAVTVSANPVLFSGAPSSLCSGNLNTWYYNQVIRETSGVGVTIQRRTSTFNGTVVSDVSSNYVIAANGTLNFGTTTWCATGSDQSITVATTWYGVDARGRSWTYVGPSVILLARGITSTTPPRFFPATWVSASWGGGRTGSPLNSRGIDPPTWFGLLCPAKALVLQNHPENDTFESIGGAFYVSNVSCTPTIRNAFACRTAGSGGGASQIPVCAVDPRQTLATNMTWIPSVGSSRTYVGSSPVNFDINIFWCSDLSRMNFGTYPTLNQTDCIER